MLSEIFKALLITSLAGSCLAAVITIVKPATKKVFGYSWHYYIWLAVLTVMILPVRFTLPQKTDIPPVTVMQSVQTEQMAPTVPNTGNIVSDAQIKPQTDIWQAGTSLVKRIIDNRLNILAYLWLAGMILLLSVNLAAYINLIIKMRKNSVVVSCPEIAEFTRREITTRVWENTSSPFMVGIFKPTLVLPAIKLTEEQLVNILRHEMTHFRRHDILYKWFAVLTGCVHWFNPVIWYVIKQINTECEISCDMAVTLNMNADEEMSYIDTVLSLLTKGKTKQIPLTTQMASSKRVLKRRFKMIRHKRRTSKFVSALSAMLAVVMLVTTVFASGALSSLTENNYKVMFSNNAVSNEEFEVQNKAFIESGEVYVPLRELFGIVGVMSNEQSYIKWNDGKIELAIAYYDDSEEVLDAHKTLNNGQGVDYVAFIFNYAIEIGKSELKEKSQPDYWTTKNMNNAPILQNGITYIPYSYIRDICDNTQQWDINYSIYDKSGNLISSSFGPISDNEAMLNIENYEDKTMACYDLTDKFFAAFENGDMNTMKQYGTDKFQRYYFHDDKFLSMKQGELVTVYSIRIFTDGRYYVHLRMNSDELEENEPDKKGVFFAILEEQDNGEFLISEFQPSDKDKWEDTNNNLSVGTIIIDENNTVVYKGENLQNPESTITSFFEAFENSNFTLMKNYCTKNCIDNFFGDNYVFGMKKATLQSISKDSDDLRKRGFVVGEWAALVNVTMTPDENSVYEPNQTATSFYLILKQQNGRYLIDEFATGL